MIYHMYRMILHINHYFIILLVNFIISRIFSLIFNTICIIVIQNIFLLHFTFLNIVLLHTTNIFMLTQILANFTREHTAKQVVSALTFYKFKHSLRKKVSRDKAFKLNVTNWTSRKPWLTFTANKVT